MKHWRQLAMVARLALLVLSYVAVSTILDDLYAIREGNLVKRFNPSHTLLFEANQGQAASNYRFLARDKTGTFLLGSDQFVYGKGTDAVRLVFAGANRDARVSGLELQPGKASYLIGADPSRWIRDVASYARVRVRSLYPGIDAVYYGSEGELETDFVVQPHFRPEAVRLRIEGGGKPSITPAGDLRVHTRGGLFELRKPKVYQRSGKLRRLVASRYEVRGQNEIGFVLSDYDPSQPLVIDPVLTYSSYLGGSGNETAVRVAMDRQGNAYLTGPTSSVNYPVTAGALASPASGAFNDVLVTKLNSQGAMVYSTRVGGSGDDIGLGIAVDAGGQAYVTGSTSSKDFPTHAALQAANQGSGDAFVFALNAAGNGFVYSTYLGGGALDAGTAIAVDGQGNAYVAGATSSTNFPTMNPIQGAQKGGKGGTNQQFFMLGDTFVTKLGPTGALAYSTYYGGSNDEAALAIAVDGSGAAYVAGFTTSSDFPVQAALQSKYGGAGSNSQVNTGDAFVFKLSPSGAQVVYSTYLGGSADDIALGIAVDSSGNAYVAGSTFSTNFPVVNASQGAYGGQGSSDFFRMSSGDGFVAKINPSGNALLFSTYLGGSDDDRAYAIAVDGAGNIHVAGNTASANFPVSSDAAQKSLGGVGTVDTLNLLPGGYVKSPVGFGDAFYARFSSTGSLTYNTYLGGSDDDVAAGLAVDSAGNAYLSGNTASSNFPLAGSTLQRQLGGLSAEDSAGHQLTSLLFGDAFFAIFRTPAAPPSIAPGGVVSAGQFGGFSAIAPGSWIEIYGSNLAADTRSWGGADFQGVNAPTSLDGTTVTIGGQSAFVDYVSPGQVNVQVPSNVGTGAQPVAVSGSLPFTITVNPLEPGLLAPTSFQLGVKQYVAALFADGVTYVLPPGAIPGVASRRAKPGDIIILYGVGFGPVTPTIPAGQVVQQSNKLTSAFQVFVGGVAADVQYAGLAPTYVGLYQINLAVPNVSAGDAVPLTFTLSGTSGSQTLYTTVE